MTSPCLAYGGVSPAAPFAQTSAKFKIWSRLVWPRPRSPQSVLWTGLTPLPATGLVSVFPTYGTHSIWPHEAPAFAVLIWPSCVIPIILCGQLSHSGRLFQKSPLFWPRGQADRCTAIEAPPISGISSIQNGPELSLLASVWVTFYFGSRCLVGMLGIGPPRSRGECLASTLTLAFLIMTSWGSSK
jgi:hypothetical protein